MFVLDTDLVTLLEEAHSSASERLAARLDRIPADEVMTTIVTYEEQTRGWLAYMARSKLLKQQVDAYRRLERHVDFYRKIAILPFDESAATEFQRLKRLRVRVGTMDLRIAAVVLARGATLLSRNLADFRKVPGLAIADWST